MHLQKRPHPQSLLSVSCVVAEEDGARCMALLYQRRGARRMLKQWVVLGKHLGSKDEHKAAWDWVVAQAADGTLPSEEALDRAPVLFAPISG